MLINRMLQSYRKLKSTPERMFNFVQTFEMKKLLLLTIFSALTLTSFGQEEMGSCSTRKSSKQWQTKSASLTVAEIAETEKYDVHFYNLDLNMNNISTYLSGSVEIHAKAKVNLDSALIELFETLIISEVQVNGTNVNYHRVLNKVRIPVNTQAQAHFVIKVTYAGNPPTAQTNPLGGSGLTAGSSPSWGNKVVWSLSEPFSAYEWFAVKQSLTDKADSCAVAITVPDTCKAGSNGLLENVEPLGNGFTRYEWKHRHPIAYYLISVAVAKYVDYSIYANPVGSTSPVLIQNYIYNNPQTLPNFIDEINETADFMELFANQFGPYPFADEKYGHCMAPLGGGMEHQTMTTQGFFEKTLTAHELAHQWWGNNVTCASWCDIWINEGFASYSEYLMLAALYPGQQVNHMTQVHQNVMSQAGGSVWVLDSLNEARIFNGRLSYDKGAGIIHSLRYFIQNDSLFFGALQDFQNTFADSTATGLDFKNHVANFCSIDLDSFFEQWYFGEGFPTYQVKYNQVGTDLILEISHTVSMPNVTPTFTNPVTLKLSRQGQADTLVRFPITSNSELFTLANYGTLVGTIGIDPSNWLINGNAGVSLDPTLGFSDQPLMQNTQLEVYPNPSTNFISIKGQTETLDYIFYDANGKTVQRGTVDKEALIDVSALQNGTYILKCVSQNQQQYIRLVTIK
jgi:aminopeptidase N